MQATTSHPCHECGKEVKTFRYWVESYDGGAKVRMKGEPPPDDRDAGYMGWHPVGSDCARKLRQNGVLIFDETKDTP